MVHFSHSQPAAALASVTLEMANVRCFEPSSWMGMFDMMAFVEASAAAAAAARDGDR
jgi:hypothetical protein